MTSAVTFNADLEQDHMDELQRAMAAAAAWRNKLQTTKTIATPAAKQPAPVQVATVENKAPNDMERPKPAEDVESAKSVEPRSADALHTAELQAALEAAASWRRKMQYPSAPPSVVAPEEDWTAESSEEDDSTEKIKHAGCVVESGSTTASGTDGSDNSDGEEDAGSCWVCATFLEDTRKILKEGLWASSKHRVRIFAGPWGRTSLARRGEDTLVYIDASLAYQSGADLRFCKNGLLLGKGSMIPPSCLRKVVRMRDGEVLYERITSAEDMCRSQAVASSKVRTQKPRGQALGMNSKESTVSPLAALLRA